jgi:hypothetical protein
MRALRVRFAAAGIALFLPAATACSSSHHPAPTVAHPSARVATPQPTRTLASSAAFLTMRGDPARGLTFELRAISDGHVLDTVLRAKGLSGIASAAAAPDGSVLMAQNGECSSSLKRLDLTTGGVKTIRTIPGQVYGMVVDPSGTKIAYLTYATCNTFSCPRGCAAPSAGPPDVLVVLDLTSGHAIRTIADSQVGFLEDVTWSPDGTQLAIIASGRSSPELLLLSARAPNFAAARPITARLGCRYIAATWPATGIIAAETCNGDTYVPSRLVDLTPAGVVRAAWRLPACVAGLRLASPPGGSRTLVDTDIEYDQDRTCAVTEGSGLVRFSRISIIDGTRLRTVLQTPSALEVSLMSY